MQKTSTKNLLHGWLQETSLHGIPKIYRTESHVTKVYWSIFVFISMAFSLYFIYVSIYSYLLYSVVSQTNIVRQPSILFPVVTVCSKQSYKLSSNASSPVNKIRNLALEMNLKMFEEFANSSTDLNTLELYYEYLGTYLASQQNFSKTEQMNVLYNINEMLIKCSFNGHRCLASDFQEYFSDRFGVCYKFNGNYYSRMSLKSPGKTNGLSLDLFLGYPNKSFGFRKSHGAILYIHNSSANPVESLDGISLEVGTETDIRISQENYQRLPSPYSDCVFNVNSKNSVLTHLERLTIDTMSVYGQKHCLLLCLQLLLIEKCECWDVRSQKPLSEHRPCNISKTKEFVCLNKTLFEFYSTSANVGCFQNW
jgi:hypothetical protein